MRLVAAVVFAAVQTGPAWAQKAPEIGYVFPPGGRAGTTINVRLGGYDWTPDMQFFAHSPGVKLEPTSPPSEIFVPPPPYWFGAKAYLSALPLPREVPARITLPAGLPPGPVRWQAANANGSTGTGLFVVSDSADGEEVLEEAHPRGIQRLTALPVTISGRLFKNEEVDRYRFTAPHAGPVTIELMARRLGANFNGAVEVRDSSGTLLVDAADTAGRDLALTFAARQGDEYTVSLRDVDFRGDRSYVYRLGIHPGPRVLAALPAAGRRGETQAVEFLVDTGAKTPERISRPVSFPATPGATSFRYRLETPGGTSRPYELALSDLRETVSTAPEGSLAAPGAVTGLLDGHPTERYRFAAKKGEVWKFRGEARALGVPVDLALAIAGSDGKEVAANDDLPGTTDPGLDFTVPADGEYTVAITDQSGGGYRGPRLFRLSIERAAPDFRLTLAQPAGVPIGGAADLVVKAARTGGLTGPIRLTLSGLPEGVTAPADLAIPANAGELKISLKCAADVAASASLVSVRGEVAVDGKSIARVAVAPGTGSLCPDTAEENEVPYVLLATTMKAVCKVEPVDKDGGRRIHRGATYPAPVVITRENGYAGPVELWMSAHQSYTCMGITGPDITVPAGVSQTTYPCFMPEWLETARTSRMVCVAVARVPDPKGHVRCLMTAMDGRITMSMEGALLKLTHAPAERTVRAGTTFRVPIKIARSPELALPVRIDLQLPEELQGLVTASPLMLPPDRSDGEVMLTTKAEPLLEGDRTITLRATAMQPGNLAVISETEVPVRFLVP